MLIFRNDDNAIVFNDAIELTENGARGEYWYCHFITSADHSIVAAESPADWKPQAFIWNGTECEANPNYVQPAVDYTNLKATLWNDIKAERDKRLLNGGYQVNGDWFHSDTFSRTQQIGLVMMGSNVPANLQWKTMSGDFITMTQTLANQIFTAAATSDAAIFARAEEIKVIMESDPEHFNLSDCTWPVNFYR